MDSELKEQLNRIETFLFEQVATKEELSELSVKVSKLEESVARLTDSVEKLTTTVHKMVDENTVMKHQVMVMQDWIRKASEKLGIEFKL